MLDVHSHKGFGQNVVHNIVPTEWADFVLKYPEQPVSVGIHPWHIEAETLAQQLDLLAKIVGESQVRAVGETGLDKRCEVPIALQMQSLERHVELSEKHHKPLILHCVAAYNELQTLKRTLRPTEEWILHGFRGNPILAQQLLADGFRFSIGWNFNVATVKMLPSKSFYFETDDADVSIEAVYQKVIATRN